MNWLPQTTAIEFSPNNKITAERSKHLISMPHLLLLLDLFWSDRAQTASFSKVVQKSGRTSHLNMKLS